MIPTQGRIPLSKGIVIYIYIVTFFCPSISFIIIYIYNIPNFQLCIYIYTLQVKNNLPTEVRIQVFNMILHPGVGRLHLCVLDVHSVQHVALLFRSAFGRLESLSCHRYGFVRKQGIHLHPLRNDHVHSQKAMNMRSHGYSSFSDRPIVVILHDTVDGRNPAPVDKWQTSHYLQGFNHPFQGAGFHNHPQSFRV